MKSQGRGVSWHSWVLMVIGGVAAVSISHIASIARANNETSQQQDVLRLESRITQLEQRLFVIENSVRTVEQQSRTGNVSSRTVSQEEFNVVRSELQALERRLGDDECGIAKLDERTLSPQRRQARRSAGTGSGEQCRQNSDVPLRLP
jgi:hypothetical protein